ncbi:cyclic phosphodiesterase-like [Chenopodium quinoa]|uniref:RNA ligase/cyclic nucleotide phosphodiesterase family protein n=1 Tax=Chenopodium quinoa TaxID=63459 RepID=A0A803MVD1_CHEQI|nr:cyclic phosphodiesterase-like [Chenopodium quinoa]
MSHHTIDRKPSGDEEGAYAVWATPSKDAKIRLKKLMSGLRSKFGGPKFDPHLTVVGPISLTGKDATEKFRAACRGLKVYPAQAQEISTGNSFWQSVYLRLDATPEVLGISSHFDEHFGNTRTTPYLPHMSLLYGDLTDEEKNEAIDEAKTLDDTIDSMSFAIDRLELYITPDDKTLKSWIKVEEYVLCAH